MKVLQAFRYELDPNNAQKTALAKHAGTARYAYNWGLAERIKRFAKNKGKKKFTNAVDQHRAWNVWKRKNVPWWVEASKCAPQEALRDLDRAFRNFWVGRKSRHKVGFPRPRKRGQDDKFRLTGSIHVAEGGVSLPRLGSIRTKESTHKFDGRILSATVKRKADRWFVSLQVERERPDPSPVEGPIVGVDLGLKSFAVVSGEAPIIAPKPLANNLKRFTRLSRQHSRKQKGSKNRRKSALRLARFHRRIANLRRDFLHKFTTRLAKTKRVVVVEDLNVSGMVRNRCHSRAVSDAGWSEARRMLEYKCPWYGSELVVASRWFPSTRRCSSCGHKGPKLPLSCRVFRCEQCGFLADRDANAAENLKWYGQFGRNPTPVETGSAAERRLAPVYEHPVAEAGSKRRLAH